MSETELLDYFNEHVFYELLMLNYTRQCLEEKPSQLVWNAMFAAFNVSARNLYYFVGRRDGDNMNVADYRPYCRTFERGSIDHVEKTLRLLHEQCLHLGKTRTKEPDKKINLDRIGKVSAWVVSNLDALLKSLSSDFRSKLLPEWDGLIAQKRIVGVSGPTGPAWAVLTTAIATGPTGAGYAIEFDSTPKK
jgi:hypothetical protein